MLDEKSEAVEKKTPPRQPERRGTRKLKLTRSIVLGGEHAEAGSIVDVSRVLAQRLIGEGSAEAHYEEGDEPETGPSVVNRMEHPTNADPPPKILRTPPPKVKDKK
jgi:hypothetical protein